MSSFSKLGSLEPSLRKYKRWFLIKGTCKKHIRSENSAQTKDKCVCNKVQMAGFISFMFSTELPYIKAPRVSRFYKTQSNRPAQRALVN